MIPEYPTMTLVEALDGIESCFGRTGGWWVQSNGEEYKRLMLALVHQGLSYGAAYQLLETAFAIASQEYGD